MVRVPDSNRAYAEDRGVKAHTNVRFTLAVAPGPAEAPPFAGYGYETPASLACIYRVVTPIRGCNPNSTKNTPDGGSESIAIVDAFDHPNAASDLETFSMQFGLPFNANKFKVVYAQGTQPPQDSTEDGKSRNRLTLSTRTLWRRTRCFYLVEAKQQSR